MPANDAALCPEAATGSGSERIAAGLTLLARVAAVFGAILLLILPLPVVFEVVMDQLRAPPTWVFETTGYAIIMIVFASSGYALKTGHHFRVSLLADRFPHLERWLGRLSGCCEFAFGVVLLVAGWNQAWGSYVQDLQSDTLLAVPQAWPQLAFPLGGLVIGLQGVAHILDPRIARLHDAVRR